VKIAAAILVLVALAAPAARAQRPPQGVFLGTNDGAALYAANCASCHGAKGEGVPPPGRPGAGGVIGMGPSLRNVGAGAADFYLRTGYMPLAHPDDQPSRARVLFDPRQIRALVGYIASFGAGPPIPQPHPEHGDLAEGLRLFTGHCAGCHQIVARGGVVTGARVPPLDDATPVEIAEAVRRGPYVMPRFTKETLSDAQLNSLIRYVEYVKQPPQTGGWGIGFLGPVPEGMVVWLIAAAALVAVCLTIGRRLRT
jgi:ubiquinol-cytochrome c reductase cytochrome c subunit